MLLLLWRLNVLGFEIRRDGISFQPKDLVQWPLKPARKNRRCWPEYQQQQPNNKIFLFSFYVLDGSKEDSEMGGSCWMQRMRYTPRLTSSTTGRVFIAAAGPVFLFFGLLEPLPYYMFFFFSPMWSSVVVVVVVLQKQLFFLPLSFCCVVCPQWTSLGTTCRTQRGISEI